METIGGVIIRLFVDGGRYSGPEAVHVNGKRWMIPRGQEVFVPQYVADTLRAQCDSEIVIPVETG